MENFLLKAPKHKSQMTNFKCQNSLVLFIFWMYFELALLLFEI